MEQLTFLKCRDADAGQPGGPDGSLHKRGRFCAPATMHGVSVSDHGEKGRWSNVDYWEMRKKKLEEQTVDADLYSAISSRLAGGGSSSDSMRSSENSPSQIFASCHLYFDGRVDGGGEGLSAFGLGKLARLHGAHVGPVLTKRGVTHVICTQLSGSKEKQVLRSASSTNNKCQYFVLPAWITESVAANRRLAESKFSLLAKIAAEARIAKPMLFHRAADPPPPPPACRFSRTKAIMKEKERKATSVENIVTVQPDAAAPRADRSRSRPRVSSSIRVQTHCARASADLSGAVLHIPSPASSSSIGSPATRPARVQPAAVEVLAIDDSSDCSRKRVVSAADLAASPGMVAPTQLDSDDDMDEDDDKKGHEAWLANALGIPSVSSQANVLNEVPKQFRRPLASGA